MEQLSFDDLETWGPVAGYVGLYEISDQGRVKSLHYWRGSNSRILKPGHTKFGYEQVILYRAGFHETKRIHCLVAETFIGPRPVGREVRHLDGDHLNNARWNLAYGTRAENMQDAVQHGTLIGNPGFKVTECAWGHLYDEANTYVDPHGKRFCRKCRNRRSEASRQKQVAARRAARVPVTHCINGHEFNEANTYVDSRGKRNCRACARTREATRRAAARVAKTAA